MNGAFYGHHLHLMLNCVQSLRRNRWLERMRTRASENSSKGAHQEAFAVTMAAKGEVLLRRGLVQIKLNKLDMRTHIDT